jgi:hypothetical protein
VLALSADTRQGELLALEWENVDPEGERLLKRAGLPPIRFHDLRYTCATLCTKAPDALRSLCAFSEFYLQIGALKRVGDSGFEPLTSSASRKRSPPELIARSNHGRFSAPPRGGTRNRTGVQGFADPCLTTRPCRQRRRYAATERKTGFEPATLTMAR